MKTLSFFLFVLALVTNKCSDSADQTSDLSTTPVQEIKQENEVDRVAKYIEANALENYARATFAGGCFWCTEAAFHRINGVVDVISGYSGGKEEYPGYKDVSYGKTSHAEAIEIFFDPEIIDFQTLLEVFYVAHDGTQLNRQGPDKGPQYRSAIYYKDDTQKALAESYIESLETDQNIDIVTEIAPYTEFWVAEKYHQNFYELNPNQGYVAKVSRPKVEKVMKQFPHLIKKKLKP